MKMILIFLSPKVTLLFLLSLPCKLFWIEICHTWDAGHVHDFYQKSLCLQCLLRESAVGNHAVYHNHCRRWPDREWLLIQGGLLRWSILKSPPNRNALNWMLIGWINQILSSELNTKRQKNGNKSQKCSDALHGANKWIGRIPEKEKKK